MADNNKTKMVLNRDNSIIVNPAAFSEVHSSDYRLIFGRPFVKRFALCYRTVSLSVLSCQSVTLLYCGQTVGWIKMKLDTELGLGPGHIVLDEEPASASKMGHSFPIFDPCLLSPKGWMDQDSTWDGGRPCPRRHCVRWRPSSPPKKGAQPTSNFRCMPIVAKRLDGSRYHLVGR